jgi:polyphenol oxidase
MPYGGFNLGQHVGDDSAAVDANRNQLLQIIPEQPLWLNQVHGTRVLELPVNEADTSIDADAVMTTLPGVVCAVMTADCLPVLLADKAGRVVGAAHAGWRGLAAGVLEALVHKMTTRVNALPQDLVAWLGPAIGPEAFEVGGDVREAFVDLNPLNQNHFNPGATGKWLADLPAIAAAKLRALGVSSITPSGYCTYTQPERFYSFRRDQVTGRMATMIWINP